MVLKHHIARCYHTYGYSTLSSQTVALLATGRLRNAFGRSARHARR